MRFGNVEQNESRFYIIYQDSTELCGKTIQSQHKFVLQSRAAEDHAG
jgi:hypothetical protein